jgi:hypothetical protein
LNIEKVEAGYLSFAPQLGQNFVPVGASVPHFAHFTVAFIGFPQFTQNFEVVGLAVPHFGQLTVSAVAACACPGCCMGVPQLLQNFDVCGFWKPHFGQTTMTC